MIAVIAITAYSGEIVGIAAAPTQDVRAFAREALANAQSQLRSGRGKAENRIYDASKRLIQEVHVDFAFEGTKYYLKMDFRLKAQPQFGCDRKIIVCDGSATFANCFSQKIRPVGCETSAYPADADVRTVAEGFPYDFRCLSRRFGAPEEFDKREFRFERLSNGHYRGTTVVDPNYTAVIEIAPEAGWNIVATGESDKTTKGDFVTGEWKRQKGIWHLVALTHDEHSGRQLHKEFRCTEFEVNVPVSPRLFTMDALEMCGGSRIIDRRPDAKVRIYKPAPLKSTDEKKLDTMLGQLENMPPKFPPPKGVPPTHSAWRIVIVVLNIAAVLGIGCVLWYFARRRRRSA